MRRKHWIHVALALAALGVAALALQAAPEPPRTIRLEARDMAFYLAGSEVPNPTLEAGPGERLRLVLVQADRGYDHDLRLPDLGLATRTLSDVGASTAITLTAPEAPGAYRYDCSLHPQMMSGTLSVR